MSTVGRGDSFGFMASLEQELLKRGLGRVKASNGGLLRETSLGSGRGCQSAGNLEERGSVLEYQKSFPGT